MEQLGLEGMPVRLFSCTPSRLTSWQDCPHRYRLTYLARPAPARGPASAHLTLGAVVHLALARFWDLPVQDRSAAAARRLVVSAWQPDGFADAGQAARWRERAADMVAAYVQDLDPTDEPAGVERTVAFKSSTLAVSGRVDRVDRRGDEVVVVDYKTGRRPSTQDDARGSLALALYALGCARTFRTSCVTVELHHVPTGQVASHTHTEASLERHLRRAEGLAAQVQAATAALEAGGDPDELFPPRPSSLCSWCDVARHCPQGALVAPSRPWDGLPAERSPCLPRSVRPLPGS